jgi:hypothetical protein
MLFYVLVLLLESMKIIITNNSEFCLFVILNLLKFLSLRLIW